MLLTWRRGCTAGEGVGAGGAERKLLWKGSSPLAGPQLRVLGSWMQMARLSVYVSCIVPSAAAPHLCAPALRRSVALATIAGLCGSASAAAGI